MQVNKIHNTQTNTNFKAKINIIGDSKLFSQDQLGVLTKKAESLGTDSDMIIIGLTRTAKIEPTNIYKNSEKYKKLHIFDHPYTMISGMCHTFFDVKEPASFIERITIIPGSRSERAKRSFDIICNYLDGIKTGIAHLE